MLSHYRKNQNREIALDLLRGTAIILMILSHGIFFVHDNSSLFLRFIARFSNSVVFTLFMFVSGASLYTAHLSSLQGTKLDNKHIIKRSIYLLFGFYVIAFTASLKSFVGLDSNRIFTEVIKILLFINVPSFSEFIIPFIVFSLSVFFLRPVYKKAAGSIRLLLTISVAAFISAYLIYPLVLAFPFREIKALIVGDEGLLRFPLMQYLSVFLLGIYWGKKLFENNLKSYRERLALVIGSISLLIFSLSFIISNLIPVNIINPLNRWPPSAGFLSLGISFSLFVYLFYSTVPKPAWTNRIWTFIDYLGRDAFDLYIVNTLLFFGFDYFIHIKYDHPLTVLLITLGIFILSVVISSLNWKVSPSVLTIGPVTFGQKGNYRLRKRYLLSILIFIGFIIFNAYTERSAVATGGTIEKERIIGFKEYLKDKPSQWFNSDYGYYQQLTITNNSSFLPVKKGESISFDFNNNSPVNSAVIVYYQENSYHLTPFVLENTTVKLEIFDTIFPNTSDNRYFIYYGSDFPAEHTLLTNDVPTLSEYSVILGDEVKQDPLLTVKRKWNLKNTNEVNFVLTIDINDSNQYIWEIAETKQTGIFEKINGNNLTSVINTNLLSPGEYTLTAKNQSDNSTVGRRLKFYISEPVYLAWTLDWEGWDVSDETLSNLYEVSNQYKIPITHFFNPRIYLPQVMPENRSEYLTNWLKSRVALYDDEVALHLHMHYDLIQNAGFTPKTSPAWGFRNSEGYDVLTTAYSYDELKILLNRAKEKFALYGLPNPVGYRAGGWFADSETLRVLTDSGFRYDSSGREHKLWNGSYISPWNLTSTTQPYYPSFDDQNIKGETKTILEIPNNGGNSYEYSAKQLISFFTSNYQGGIKQTPVVVTVMSHPQWFETEGIKIKDYLSYVGEYSFEKDKGPVVFTTLNTVYDLWK